MRIELQCTIILRRLGVPGQQPPADEDEVSSNWIAVIGHRQFWPVAALNEVTSERTTSTDKKRTLTILPPASERGDEVWSHDYGDPRLPEIRITMWVLLIVCLVWACIHWWLRAFPSTVSSPRCVHILCRSLGGSTPALIVLAGLLLASLAVVVAADRVFCVFDDFRSALAGVVDGAALVQRGGDPPILFAGWFCAVLLVSFLSVRRNCRRTPLGVLGQPGLNAGPRARAFVAAVVGWIGVLCLYLYRIAGLTGVNATPTYWRCVNLASGVSPLLPQLFLAVVLYAWFWCRLRGLAHHDRPISPSQDDLPLLPVVPGIAGTPKMPMFQSRRSSKRS
jgi:hypothetical protein